MENPTSWILYNFVIAPAHALISSTYLTHHPTKSNCTLCFSKYILHFPTSMPHPLCLEWPRMLFLHLCLWKPHPFSRLRNLVFYNHFEWKESPFLPEFPHGLLASLWCHLLSTAIYYRNLCGHLCSPFLSVTATYKITSYSQKVVKRALAWE